MATIRKLSPIKYRADIRRNNTFIQSKTFPTKKDAENWANEKEANIEKILELRPKQLKKLTPKKVENLGGIELFLKLGVDVSLFKFSDLVDEYIAQWNQKDQNQIPRAEFWKETFGEKPVKSISTDRIRKALKKYAAGNVLKGNGLGKTRVTNKSRSSNTVLRMKAVLSSIFKYAIDEGYLKNNPVAGIKIAATPNQIGRFLTEEELHALLKASKDSTWDKLNLLILMGVMTGMRRSEMMGLRWSSIDFTRNLAILGDTKNGTQRRPPIPKPVMDELLKFRELGTGLVFCRPKNSEKPFNFRVQWEHALERAKVKNFRFHDLRHTTASYLVMDGVTLHETGKILGHKCLQTTERYSHLSTDRVSELSEKTMGKMLKAS